MALCHLFLFLCSFFWWRKHPITWGGLANRPIYRGERWIARYALRAMAMEPANEHNPVLLNGILQRQLGLLDDAYISFLGNNPMPEVVLHHRASLLCDMDRFDRRGDYDAIIRHPRTTGGLLPPGFIVSG